MSAPTPAPEPGYSLLCPQGRETPIIVEVPHAGLRVDPQPMAHMQVPLRSLGRDADLYMDRVCEPLCELGAHVLIAHVSRYVCDLNRAPDAYDAQTGAGGRLENAPHGVFWRTTTEGHPVLLRPLSEEDINYRRRHYYDPYHRALKGLIDRLHQRFGYVLLLCAHSMPSPQRGRGGGSGGGHPTLADIVPGSQGWTSAARAGIEAAETVARAQGFSVKHDTPYAGGFTTAHYGTPARGIHALQLEVRRDLYMDEDRLTIRPAGLSRVQLFFAALVQSWAALPSRLLTPENPKTQTT